MADTLQVQIVTPYGEKLTTEADEVTCPGHLGEFGVLPEHLPLLTRNPAGKVTFTSGGKDTVYAVGRGFIHVGQNRVLMLVESAERADEIEADRSKESLERAEKRLAKMMEEKPIDDPDVKRAMRSKQRAETRLEIAQK